MHPKRLEMERKEIDQIWQNSLSELRPYKLGRLYKIIGPFVAGIELIRLPFKNYFRPHFVVYSFWRRPDGEIDAADCFREPIILSGIRNKKNLLLDISLDAPPDKVLEAIDECKTQFLFPLDGDVHFPFLREAFLQYRQGKHHELPSPFQLVAFYDFLFNCSLYVEDIVGASTIIEALKADRFIFELARFKLPYKNLNLWLDALEKRYSNRAQEIWYARDLLENRKLSRLKRSELVL